MMLDLLDEQMDEIELPPSHDDETWGSKEARNCDGCGEARPDVDIWATNDETGRFSAFVRRVRSSEGARPSEPGGSP